MSGPETKYLHSCLESFHSYPTIETKNFHTKDKTFPQQNRKVKKNVNAELNSEEIFLSRKEKL